MNNINQTKIKDLADKGNKSSVKEKDSVSRFIDEGNPNTAQTIKKAQHKEHIECEN